MNTKKSLRRTMAGMLAVLVVSGNTLLPGQSLKQIAPAPIEADASHVRTGNYTWDESTGTLTITGSVTDDYDPSEPNLEPITVVTGHFIVDQTLSKDKIKHIVIAATAQLPESCEGMFADLKNLESVVFAEYVDGTPVRKMSTMFKNCPKLKSVDLSGLINTQGLEYIDNIFDKCPSLEALDLSNIDGTKICQGRWYENGVVHPAVDAIKEAVKNCDDLKDFELSSEFLHHCVINSQNNPNLPENQNVTIETVLDSLLSGNPNADAFKTKFLTQYNEWLDNNRIDIRNCTITGTDGKEYDGTGLDFTVKNGDTTLVNGTDYTVTFKRDGLTEVSEAKDAGSYSYTIEGINNYKDKITGNVTISPRTAELHWGNSSFHYDGNEHCPTATVGNLVDGDECTVTVTGGKKGEKNKTRSYPATASELSNPNYVLPSNNTHQFTIYKNEITGVTATGYEGIYDKAAHGITVNKGSSNSTATITYGLDVNDIDSFTSAQPTLIDAGTYEVFYKVSKKNYADFIGSATVVINPKEAGIEWGTTEFDYDGTEKCPTATATGLLSGDESDVTVTGGQINAGTYTATATGFTNGNYKLASEETTEFVINSVAMEVSAEDVTADYNGSEYSITVNAPEGAQIQYKTGDGEYSDTNPTFKDADTYTVDYKVTKDNYIDVTGSATVTINKRVAQLDWTDTSFTYDGKDKCPKAAVHNLVDGDTCNVTVVGAQKNAGTHTATATALDNNNYALPDVATQSFVINNDVLEGVSAADVTAEYDGQSHGITVTGAPEDAVITYSSAADGEFTAEQPVCKDAGPYVIFYKVEAENYDAFISSANVTISQREVGLAWGEQTSFVYGGFPQCPTVELTNIVDGDECGFTLTGAGINVGNYTAEVKDLTNLNYKLPADATKGFDITGADIVGLSVEGFSVKYDGQEHRIKINGLPEGATVTYQDGYDEPTTEEPVFVNYTGYHTTTVRISVENYNTYEDEVKTEILRADPGLKVSIDGWTAGEEPNAPVVSKKSDGEVIIQYKAKNADIWSNEVPTDAGDYTVKATIAETQNYMAGEAEADFRIDYATFTYKVSNFEGEYDGQPHSIDVELPEGATIVFSNDGFETYSSDIPTWTDADTYVYDYKISKKNCEDVTGSAYIDITPRTAVFDWGTTTLVYNGDDQTLAPVVTNLVTGDECEVIVSGYGRDVSEIPYYAVATGLSNDNYKLPDEGCEVAFYIIPKSMQDEVSAQGYTGVYDGGAYGITVTAPKDAVIYYFGAPSEFIVDPDNIPYDDYNPTFTDANYYVVYYKVTKENYKDVTGSAVVNIGRADPELKVSIEGWMKGEEANKPVISGKYTEDAYIEYAVRDSDEWTTDVPTEVGDYTVRVSVDTSDNYIESSAECDFSIGHYVALIKGNTVSFKDSISLNFFAEIDEPIADGAYVVFSYSHYGKPETQTVYLDKTDTLTNEDTGKEYYRFRCKLTASEMAIDVHADLYLADSDAAVSSGDRSMYDYCLAGLAKSKNEEEKALFRAALNYGAYCQTYFGYNTELLANDSLESDLSEVTVTSDVEFNRPTGYVEGIKYMGSTLLFKDAPFVRYYFTLENSDVDINDYVFAIGGKTIDIAYSEANDMYYLESVPELAYQLDNAQAVTVTKKDGTSVFSFDYSVIKWAEIAAANSKKQSEINMAKGLYEYYLAAKAYVEKNN